MREAGGKGERRKGEQAPGLRGVRGGGGGLKSSLERHLYFHEQVLLKVYPDRPDLQQGSDQSAQGE